MSDLLRVLIGCEYSGAVREEFRKLGHDAWSCDLLQSDDGSGFHEVCDVFKMIESREWDIIILHPPCTALAVSGNAHYGRGMAKEHLRGESIKWTMDLWGLATRCCNHVALENPVGVLSNHIPVKPSYIQPYEFGHPESKKTGLWLHGLPPLVPTNDVKEEYDSLPRNERMRVHYMPPSPDRWKLRSVTYSGIAAAMADQWSEYVLNN